MSREFCRFLEGPLCLGGSSQLPLRQSTALMGFRVIRVEQDHCVQIIDRPLPVSQMHQRERPIGVAQSEAWVFVDGFGIGSNGFQVITSTGMDTTCPQPGTTVARHHAYLLEITHRQIEFARIKPRDASP